MKSECIQNMKILLVFPFASPMKSLSFAQGYLKLK